MNQNYTTPITSPPHSRSAFPGYFALISLILLTLIASIVAAVCYFRRRARIDELRHRLIPLYTYNPAEEEEVWDAADVGNEEKELVEPLYKEAQLSFPTDYGT